MKYLLVAALVLASSCRDPGREGEMPPPPSGPDGGAPQEEVVQCPQLVQPSESGVCRVIPGTGSATLLRGNVLTAGSTLENGSVLIDGNEIICASCDCSASPGFADATIIECAHAAISPGLINPHDHLRFTEGAPISVGTTRYDHRHDWRGSLSTPQNPNGTNPTSDGMRWGEIRMLLAGATSIVGSGRADGMLRNLDDLGSADESLGFREAKFTTFSLGDSNESFRENCGWNYAFEEDEVADMNMFLPHVAEGIDTYAADEFFCQSRSTEGAQDFTESNVAHIHSIGLTAEDYLRMALDRAKIIWSPRSNISLYGHTAKVSLFDTLGGTIALGTDWTYSGSANMVRELACADSFNRKYLNYHFSDHQIWLMATRNAAIATSSDHLIGSLKSGLLADIAIFAGTEGQYHRAIFEANSSDVVLVLKEGRPLYGQTELVAAFGSNCDPINVCGEDRSICSTAEFGKSFSDIKAAVSGAYSEQYCDSAPVNEPTCTPSRPSEFNGVATDSDSDGDGIDNAVDNCTQVFNPVRPAIDGSSQPDADGDGLGDACDDTPLESDLDGDSTPNSVDNCPFFENPAQEDGDLDGKGDSCDFCPESANPDTACSSGASAVPATIEQVQMGNVLEGSVVTITGAVVTGVSTVDFTVQDPNAASAEYSGIIVFVGSQPNYSVGDQVDVTGTVEEFFGNTEITSPSVVVTGSATPIEATDVTMQQAVSEPYEHVLVRVNGATSEPYDCTADNASCGDTELWQIDGSIVAYNRFYEDGDWVNQTGTLPVAGVTMFRFDTVRIMPRDANDFGP